MKEPVRSKKSGLVFERATIEVWLATRGSVCPITHEPLYREDLEVDEDLRSRYAHDDDDRIDIDDDGDVFVEFADITFRRQHCASQHHMMRTCTTSKRHFRVLCLCFCLYLCAW